MTASCRLYLITPPRIDDLTGFAALLAGALDAGDVACLQLRLKGATDDDILRIGEVLMPVCHERDVAFLVNDRPDLAAALGADGVHVGQEDTPYAEARRIMGDSAIIGVTCHDSRHLAITAAEEGADYVAFGAFYPTTTKQAKSQADIDLLSWWSALMEVPAVAIGGITVANCAPLVRAGADFLAVCGGVWDYPSGAAAAIREFNRAIANAAVDRTRI